jgi:cytochrome b pre-mRNA-processing protein 3
MVFSLFGKSNQRIAHGLYKSIIAQARSPAFYVDLRVSDTVDGRFDLITLHAILVMRRLKVAADQKCADVSQELFDLMFADMDASLREMGATDSGVTKQIKAMTVAFFGRVTAYEMALSKYEENNTDQDIFDAVKRNIYRGSEHIADAPVRSLTQYITQTWAHLNAQPQADFLKGQVTFLPTADVLSKAQ